MKVSIQSVDLARLSFTGYLEIKNLTESHPTICTFFEAEICGAPSVPFVTRKWSVSQEVDHMHWTMFPSFDRFKDIYTDDRFWIEPFDKEHTHLFMRWKEQFLVPDHRVSQIPGASFSGFYYLAMNRQNGSIAGFYYHESSEPFQRLSLQFTQQQQMGTFEMA